MPGFSLESAARIAAVVRQVEAGGGLPRVGTDDNALLTYELRYFELKEDLTLGSDAEAYWLRFDPHQTAILSGLTLVEKVVFTVVDTLGLFRGRAKDKFDAPHDQGSRGLAFKPHWRKDWEILYLKPAATMIRGQATADFNSPVTIENAVVLQPESGIICDSDPADDITVANTLGFCGKDGDNVVAVWDQSAGDWEALIVTPRAEEVMTDFRVDTTNKKLQKKTRTLRAFISADESDWTDIHTGESCP